MSCECEFCRWRKEFKKHMEVVPESAKEFFNELSDVLIEAQCDAEYYKGIVEGTWPGADEVLANIRSYIKERTEDE